MRHGQTEMNVQKLNQGWWDSPLTEAGIEGARLAGRYVKAAGIKPDHLYSSSSERACDTLELVFPEQPYTRKKGLKEYHFGLFEGKNGFLNPPRPFGDTFVPFGGESDEMVRERMNDTLSEIMMQPDHQTVLAVSHGAACARFLSKWIATSNLQSYQSPIPNCSLFVYEFDDENQTFNLIDMITPDRQQAFLDEQA